ncbi:hypothetical protein ACWXVL_01850 [Mycoplasma sp. 128]
MDSIKQRMNNLTDVAHKWYEQQHNVVSQLLTTLTNEKLKNYLTQKLQENSNLKDQELKTYANAAANLENACNKVLSYQEFEKEKIEIDTWLEQNLSISDEYKTQITDKKTQAQTNIDNLLDENNKNSQAMSDVVSSLENDFNHIRLNAKKDEVSQFQTQNNQALETLNSKLEEAKVRQQLVSEINTKIQEIEDKILQSKILDNEANQTEININNFLKIAVNSISKAQLQDKSNEAQDWIAKNSQAIGNDRLETLKNIIDDVNQTINQNPDLNFDNLKDKLVLIFNKTKVAKSVSDLSNLFKNNQNLLPTLTDNSLEKSVVTAVNDNITESLKIANELLNGNKVTDKDETKLANAFSDYQSKIDTKTEELHSLQSQSGVQKEQVDPYLSDYDDLEKQSQLEALRLETRLMVDNAINELLAQRSESYITSFTTSVKDKFYTRINDATTEDQLNSIKTDFDSYAKLLDKLTEYYRTLNVVILDTTGLRYVVTNPSSDSRSPENFEDIKWIIEKLNEMQTTNDELVKNEVKDDGSIDNIQKSIDNIQLFLNSVKYAVRLRGVIINAKETKLRLDSNSESNNLTAAIDEASNLLARSQTAFDDELIAGAKKLILAIRKFQLVDAINKY